jgi:regulator of cell morphogenesis and NO signaling
MTTRIDPSISLGALVAQHPRAVRELDRLGLDYCCGGGQSLAEACRKHGFDPSEIAASIDRLEAPDEGVPDWVGFHPAALVDHLEATHHVYLQEELPRLTVLAAKVADAHGASHPELAEVRDVFAELRADLEPHLMKEERVLFPMIRELDEAQDSQGSLPSFHCGSVRNPISVMIAEHERAGELFERLRELTSAYTPPDDACTSYRALLDGLNELEADTHLHIYKENHLLFPRVVEQEVMLAERARAVG